MSKEKKKYEAPKAEEIITVAKSEYDKILSTVQESRNLLIDAYKANKELNDKYLRALADYQNLQRISATRISNSKKDGKISVIRNLISIIDDFERAIDANEVTDGIKLIYDSFISILKNAGVETINPNIGDTFDDSIHDAVIPMTATEENLKNTIAVVQQKGYKLEDSILRYAKVGVYV